jgi:hypothetical protein
MKFITVTALALTLSLAACKENQGVALGNFEKECAGLKGTLARVSANEYTCTLPDGLVLRSVDKK